MLDALVAFIVIGGAIYVLVALLMLGLCKAASEADDALEHHRFSAWGDES